MNINNIQNILTWEHQFGLLAIPLLPFQLDSFIMLNGSYGNFCLKTIATTEISSKDCHSLAWSSNTKNFVVISQEKVIVYNWLKNKAERINVNDVKENFDKFYDYLVNNSYKTDKDIVPFVISIFNQFRNITEEKTNPTEALNLLFVLLAGLKDNIHEIDFNKWGLDSIKIPNNFEHYINLLKNGVSNITPNLDTIIRHSSGILFQEAQKEASFFNRQMNIFGGMSDKIVTRKEPYSSTHYTPPFLARTIVENSLKKIDLSKPMIKILDPACGSSEFLIEALKQLNKLGYPGKVKIIGMDSSKSAISISRFLLNYEKRSIWKDKLIFDLKLVEDSLTEDWGDDNDLIFMNPPFVSWDHMDKKSRDNTKYSLNMDIAKPNQASAFFYKSILSITSYGAIGCIVPSTLLTTYNYAKLRKKALDLIDIYLIGKLGNFVFENALTDVSFIIAKKPKNDNNVPFLLWTKNERGISNKALRDLRKMFYSGTTLIDKKNYSVNKPIVFPLANHKWKPLSIKEDRILKSINRFLIEKKLIKIKDIFNVRLGIRTGNNTIFKISKDFFVELPENEKNLFKVAIDNNSINNNRLQKNSYIWYPYDANGIIIKTEDELIKFAPFFYENVLKPSKDLLLKRTGVNHSNWWLLSRHRTWLRKNTQKIVSTEFGNSSSFAFDEKGEFLIERGYAWLPKKNIYIRGFHYFYFAIFASSLFDMLLSIYCKQLAGGKWYDFGKRYVDEIPIPNIYSEEIYNTEAFNQLIDISEDFINDYINIKEGFDNILIKYFYPFAGDYNDF
ncbi:MAG: N-6 DNA methylase [Dethiobacteria bacterium]